ncbi:membrane protein [Sinomonas atrocyanea]|uniref:Membrane protein n=1 Tax=Sinomonas atrocyanea TaxID=37927 RepID=A0A126ZV86_9MICC|nr:efflux RND transporter permease subunit [Sinomonas atrocyanea]AMM30816.1 membrane protein [Sinomonas atrocyanea]GEB64948.1 membrane protein [Sinomonas atrocyanea]GGG77991.1 membrane protein [Sinomonas atrocyanea]
MTTFRRRLRWLFPALLVLAWFALSGLGGPTFGKLSSVSSSDQATFLPASAESTEVRAWQEKFTASTAIPALVVVEKDGTLSRDDLAALAPLGAKLASVAGVAPPAAGAPSSVVGPIPSKDSRAAEFIVPVADADQVRAVVSGLREAAGTVPAGLRAYVTGPAGLTADLVSAFGGIDGILLLVAVGAVFVILALVYRSVVLPFVVLFSAIAALCGAILAIYWFAKAGWITLNGQSQGILSILVIGAATDYALLLVARYREALHAVESRWDAMRRAWRAAFEPILASGATVILALLCLLFSDLNSNRSLGPIAAMGIAFSLLSSLTFLPALLVLCGRSAFWPLRPAYDAGPAARRHAAPSARAGAAAVPVGLEDVRGLWRRVGGLIARRPRTTWIVALVLLGLGAAGLPQLKANGVEQTQLVLTATDSVAGQQALARHFDAGTGSPVVVVASEDRAADVLKKVQDTPGISSASVYAGATAPGAPGTAASAAVVRDGRVLVNAVLASQPDSADAERTVTDLRSSLDAVDPQALVGGVTAIALDTNLTAQADLRRIIPLVLGVILLVLILLLRSIVAPLILIGSVVLSYAAALGVSALVFNHVFGFPGADAAVPLFGFVFLVALGVDYNIFLMTRVREESLAHGTRPGILRGLSLTGGVITSAGVVLAATFAALGVIPILFLVQIAFIVAFGVLLDTVVVRSLLVPAVAYDVGRAIWWPSRPARTPASPDGPASPAPPSETSGTSGTRGHVPASWGQV